MKIKLQRFIERANTRKFSTNEWLEDDLMKVYVRKSFRYIGGILQPMLDVASIEVATKHRGKGLFSRFMKMAIEMNPWNGVYLENAHNPILAAWAKRHGWQQSGDSFYLMLPVNLP